MYALRITTIQVFNTEVATRKYVAVDVNCGSIRRFSVEINLYSLDRLQVQKL